MKNKDHKIEFRNVEIEIPDDLFKQFFKIENGKMFLDIRKKIDGSELYWRLPDMWEERFKKVDDCEGMVFRILDYYPNETTHKVLSWAIEGNVGKQIL